MTLFILLDAVLAVSCFLAHDTVKSFQCLSSILAELVLFPCCPYSFHVHVRGQAKCQDSSFRTTDFTGIEHVTSLLVTLQKVAKFSYAHDTLAGNSHWNPAPETRAESSASCNKICASFQLWHPSTAL